MEVTSIRPESGLPANPLKEAVTDMLAPPRMRKLSSLVSSSCSSRNNSNNLPIPTGKHQTPFCYRTNGQLGQDLRQVSTTHGVASGSDTPDWIHSSDGASAPRPDSSGKSGLPTVFSEKIIVAERII